MIHSFILASQSPRRRELLTQAGYHFKVVPSTVDESLFEVDAVDPAEYTIKLALAKALEVASRFPSQWVLGADTIINDQGKIIGKPVDEAHARQMSETLFSRPHQVITGVSLVHAQKSVQLTDYDVTTVVPKPVTPAQLEKHIQGGSWQGKAGAYAIQENGDEWVERLEGSLTNVIGMPMELLERLLKTVLRRQKAED